MRYLISEEDCRRADALATAIHDLMAAAKAPRFMAYMALTKCIEDVFKAYGAEKAQELGDHLFQTFAEVNRK